ncbi:MAG: carboxymethylenebutenolidase [Saprospiraceae bacterium]|nr:carboxymethylenebutenolidase [Saprospiraceae bacterium]
MIITETIEYTISNRIYEGKISWDNSMKQQKPGVLVAPTYAGQSAFEEEKSRALAKLGYVGFALDIYGKGIRADSPDHAQKLMDVLNADRRELLVRMEGALTELRHHSEVDEHSIAAIGFCFGGKCVLDLARSGADIKGVISFHGVYDSPSIEYAFPIKSSILILHGWDDPLGTPSQTVALAQELTARSADWQMLAFGHTGHAFTNPNAQSPESGMMYNVQSNDRAWKLMRSFLAEVLTQH